jgi:CubicO group peptidase (beta-lactamase class C family)
MRKNALKKAHVVPARFLALALAVAPAFSAAAESRSTPPPGQDVAGAVASLQETMPALIKDARIPGLQLALVRDGKVVWHASFGVKNGATGEPVTDETVFEAASLTKPFFAYYAMKLVDEGVLDLDKSLVGCVPAGFMEKFLEHGLDQKGFHRDWFERITAGHVLSHSSGMPHGEAGTPFPLFFEPGTKWKYSADGYFLLQKVIEHLKGDKLENLMQKEVLDPLGMTRSCLVWRDDYEKTIANGHGFFGAPEDFRKRTESHAGATLYTTAEDYAKFVCAAMNDEGLRPETLKEMLAPRIDMDKDKGLAGAWASARRPTPAAWPSGNGGLRYFPQLHPGLPREKSGSST